MFNLIISIIAIALVVVLAGASLYYGGEAFNRGSEEAKASTFINQAQQIQAATVLYKASEGGMPGDINALVNENYMAGVPKVATGEGPDNVWEIADGYIETTQKVTGSAKTGLTKNICATITANGSGVVKCSKGTAAKGLLDSALVDDKTTDLATGADVVVWMAL